MDTALLFWFHSKGHVKCLCALWSDLIWPFHVVLTMCEDGEHSPASWTGRRLQAGVAPGGRQPIMHLALTTLPAMVNQVDGDRCYCSSKHFSRTLFHFPSLLLCYRWSSMKAISLPGSLCGLCERWDSGFKPACSDSNRWVWAFLACSHSYTLVCINTR